jgi:periplasmic divalent cation tolerance protein
MADCKQTDILSVVTTIGSLDDARRLAAALVEQRLAACVQLEPQLESHYRWEGRVCAEPEVRLTLKTVPQRLAEVQAFFAQHHPYDLPQLIWQPLAASEAYARWVREETASAG